MEPRVLLDAASRSRCASFDNFGSLLNTSILLSSPIRLGISCLRSLTFSSSAILPMFGLKPDRPCQATHLLACRQRLYGSADLQGYLLCFDGPSILDLRDACKYLRRAGHAPNSGCPTRDDVGQQCSAICWRVASWRGLAVYRRRRLGTIFSSQTGSI